MKHWISKFLKALPVCCALACGLAMAPASAALILDMNGDQTAAPYYQSYAYTSVWGASPGDAFGTIFSSNSVYSQASNSLTYSWNGATITASEITQPGGFYTAHSGATLSVTNANASDGYYSVAGTGSHTTATFFSAQALADHAVFSWHVSGIESSTPPGKCNPSAGVFDTCSTARLDFLATTDSSETFWTFGSNPATMTQWGPGTYSTSIAGMPLNQLINFFYWTSAFVQINPGALPQGSSVNYFANFTNTFDLVGIDLFDASNNLITDWTLVDSATGQTVFTPSGRVPASVPEPTTLSLLGLSLLAMGFARRRNSCAA
ncbi:MAG: PEP-CTERM sorting domain-containing protein [Burkholderiaceae bacterium]